jgi:hypothetical protein
MRRLQEVTMLYRVSDLRGLTIAATDGEIGSLDDLYFDSASWRVRYLVVDEVNWADSKVHVDLTQEAIRSSPAYDPTAPVQREYERRLYGHYQRRNYWE